MHNLNAMRSHYLQQIEHSLIHGLNGVEQTADGHVKNIAAKLSEATGVLIEPKTWVESTLIFLPEDAAGSTPLLVVPNAFTYDKVLGQHAFKDHAAVAKDVHYALRGSGVEYDRIPDYWSAYAFRVDNMNYLRVTHYDSMTPRTVKKYEALGEFATTFSNVQFFVDPASGLKPRLIKSDAA